MSRPQTFEQHLLSDASRLLSAAAHTHEERLCILEAVAAAKSQCSIVEYWHVFDYSCINIQKSVISALTYNIENSGIPFPMAIASLAREPISVEEQKKNGVFYTDFRLAYFVAESCKKKLTATSSVADFAAGTGILIAAIADLYKRKFTGSFNKWLAEKLYAFDLSGIALRGARAALLSLTNDIAAIESMNKNWKVTDSLLDSEIDKLNVDIVVGNPPWGKIKLSRHDFLSQSGEQRIYGSEYTNIDDKQFAKSKSDLNNYAKAIKKKYDLLGNAEPDMYMAFLQRAINKVRAQGHISYLVPAGLIRSQGTAILREYLFNNAENVHFVLLNNQSMFFSIDTRFKFVLVSFDKESSNHSQMTKKFAFSIAKAESCKINTGETIYFSVDQLKQARPDLTIPEVRSITEKDLFFKIYQNGHVWGKNDDVWFADIAREVDMTNDRKNFAVYRTPNAIPVVEGRMVQQHRFGTKSYVSGSGRSAKWKPCKSNCKPQFYYPKDILSSDLRKRVSQFRAGYCDIAGQTNERAMMSAIIPPNVICGNKVPTILFPNDKSGDLVYLWIGITNSFVFDWMIRRIISTTINYFLLFSIPMPTLAIESNIAQKIICKSRELSQMTEDYYSSARMAEIRSEIDVLVAEAYGLSSDDMVLIMEDFPILDRKQPCIKNEKKSTVTRDLVLSKCETYFDNKVGEYSRRYDQAIRKGARAYIPTEMAELAKGGEF